MKKFAFVFPGQGSQSVGMLSAFFEQNPQHTQAAIVANEICEQASEALGYNMAELINQGPAEKLNSTEFTQPALLAAGVACWKVWQSQSDVLPSFVAGHSLGEYTALVCAGALSFSDGLKLVAARGRYMQEACPEGVGAMAAIVGLDDAKVEQACESARELGMVAPANFNSIGQVVIAGETAAVEKAAVVAKELGAKIAKKIPVSVPSHCHLMKPAAKKLAADLESVTISEPKIAMINNVDTVIESDPKKIKDALVHQLFSPVQWVKTVNYLAQEKVSMIAECGPGKVLTGLIRRIDKQLETNNLGSPDQIAELANKFSVEA